MDPSAAEAAAAASGLVDAMAAVAPSLPPPDRAASLVVRVRRGLIFTIPRSYDLFSVQAAIRSPYPKFPSFQQWEASGHDSRSGVSGEVAAGAGCFICQRSHHFKYLGLSLCQNVEACSIYCLSACGYVAQMSPLAKHLLMK